MTRLERHSTSPFTPSPRATTFLIALLLPASALAHSGHESGGFWPGFAHALHGLDHVLAAIAVGIWATRLGGRALLAVPMAFVTAMAAGALFAAAGATMPLAESMIAASVLLTGALVALDVRFATAAGVVLVAALASAHGMAHGGEMPASAAVHAYACGLVASTGLLHAAAMTAAIALRSRPLVLRLAAAPVAVLGAGLVIARAV